jgi:hypothetical protein
MKLYNLYKEVILEATNTGDAQRAIDEHLTANIKYDNGKDDGSENVKRYCRILNIGSIKGQPAIRVFQISNFNIKKDKNGKEQRWKTFLLDKIVDIQLTNFKVNRPITTKDADIPWNPNSDITLGLGAGSPGLSKYGVKTAKPDNTDNKVAPTQPVAKYASNKYQKPIPSDPVEPKTNTDGKYQTSFKSGVEVPSDVGVPTDVNQDPEGNVFDKEPEKYETSQDAKQSIGTRLTNFFKKTGKKISSVFGNVTPEEEEEDNKIE